ncbi:ribosome small subunit-dependent GTPase A [Gordonia sp. Z-3]|uniref:ribosome small subunit-dependent GTPase A n=1 Tax=unclassified Gordonia (in: high G+C Gram-positive bacteria) TaxID=2657482 RepID=UPI002E2BC13D|nr:ribosome small subunit-dependent GTPase A [Gordonia sp. Z-3]MED5801796.1 ribosome small subunit-dependent GTPase A [Gordonia sp. Z-3]
MTVADFGWDTNLEKSFAGHRAHGLVPARVVRAERGHCDVVAETGPVRAAASPPSTAAESLTPCTGDWVALRPSTRTDTATIVAIVPRRTAVVRASAAGTSRGQVLAANVDTVVVVVSLADPIKPGRIERILALAWESGGTPVVVLTKADRCADVPQALDEVSGVAPGVQVLVTSATRGDGMDIVVGALAGTVVLLGPSGVGKSTLGNCLLGENRLATGAARSSDGKGRHTTAWRELLPLPTGGVLLDTPGLRGVGVLGVDEGLDQTFSEIVELAGDCRFTDCAHTVEPGCAVLTAVDSGEIPQRRLDSYRRLLRENAYVASRSDARLRAERERHNKKEIARMRRAIKRRSGNRHR